MSVENLFFFPAPFFVHMELRSRWCLSKRSSLARQIPLMGPTLPVWTFFCFLRSQSPGHDYSSPSLFPFDRIADAYGLLEIENVFLTFAVP